MDATVFIVACGARTAVGLQAAPSAAAVRAAINGVREHPFFVDQAGDPLLAAFDWQLDPRLTGPIRLLALAEPALREACAPLRTVSESRLRLPVYLALPEFRPGFDPRDAEIIRSGLVRLNGLPIDSTEVQVIAKGHAAGLSALATAAERIRRGVVSAALVGGVDSYLRSETLGWLDGNLQLVGASSRSSFVPGEGAGFCLLAGQALCERLRLEPLARVLAIHVGMEEKLNRGSAVCTGEGLTRTVQAVCSTMSEDARIGDVICDINGERYRSEEWGFVCLRLSHFFTDPTAYLSPADCWGDTGAASAPLFAVLACQAAARSVANGSRTLVWASSEGGLRGAAVLDTTSNGSMGE